MTNVVSIDAGDRAGLRSRRNQLVEDNLALVPPIARAIAAGLPPSFDFEDLVSAGNIGLLQAATSYRPAAHADTPFSAYARPRIRGAILDSVRRGAWREATHGSLDVPDVRERAVVVAIDESIDERRRRVRIRSAVAGLDERLRRVVDWHYSGELPLRDVGERLGVGKSRASQLHVEALRQLRRGDLRS